ncbi:4-(hydroxymethyl)-2-furancarboxaldehyde-phosphate synthase [Methylomonas albis]|uniref:(5-formylfuran-3-yl)methyl phosphate synthase n=1 Tax=Methylomonas albis TaxID=1854563 RepID=A0ABR9CXU6_9GAMM|nr:(5-formylfuran-3-yl)methyl phosphate synthase [Methylomonas albis]MBD9355709.1 (5-formylfuran-3-yl)methyl phosphate synthase [Methylomonas albis]CAD6878724.1 4-(hydroxymethyl)-2-furancarboxaldehyde-phosphate synthase [Methylomonas albis]
MTGMLASVNSLAEALLVEAAAVDIIDLKQPARGALGALDIAVVAEIVRHLQPASCVSATIGDLPMQPELILPAVQAMAATGVNYVKIGFFPGGDWLACIDGLQVLAAQGVALVAVLFADTHPDMAIIDALYKAGFRGVMLDTADKQLGSLTQLMALDELQTFVDRVASLGLLSGLAGSLRAEDVARLLPLGADYLGFRGALCLQHSRTAQLDVMQISILREHWQALAY